MDQSKFVQLFITAKDDKELLAKMYEKNVLHSASIKFDIVWKGEKLGYTAWYYADIFKERQLTNNKGK